MRGNSCHLRARQLTRLTLRGVDAIRNGVMPRGVTTRLMQPLLPLQPKSDISDLGELMPNSGKPNCVKPEFGRRVVRTWRI